MAVKLEEDMCRWVMEFLLREPNTDSIITRLLSLFPLPNSDRRLKKRILLRSLDSQISAAGISENTLQTLDLIHALDLEAGFELTDSMKAAYCSVAVECTVMHLRERDKGSYFEAVKRIWRGKVGKLVEISSGLVSDALMKWRDEIELAVMDVGVAERLVERNARHDAVNYVMGYLQEAQGLLGRSFLEMAARSEERRLKKESGVGCLREKASGDREICDNSVQEKQKEKGDCSAQVRENEANLARDHLRDRNEAREELLERDGDSMARNDKEIHENPLQEKQKETGGRDAKDTARKDKELQKDKARVRTRKKHVPVHRKHGPARIAADQEEKDNDDGRIRDDNGASCSTRGKLPSGEFSELQEALETRLIELQTLVQNPFPDVLSKAEGVLSEVQQKFAILEGLVLEKDQSEEDKNLSVNNDVNHEVPKFNEERVPNQAHEREVDCSNPENNIHAVAQNLAERDNGCTHQENNKNVPAHSLMERNRTAQTHEWDDSNGGVPNDPSHGVQLPTPPKKKASSPLRNHEPPKYVRKRKRKIWSLEEEDTLRKAVNKFGKGNWKLMLNAYRSVFEERTEVDLKDKWRNMTQQ